MKEAYEWLNNKDIVTDPSRKSSWVWKLSVSETVRVFVWRSLQDALPTNDKRVGCNLAMSAACPRCSCSVEDIMHCLRDFPHAKELWMCIELPSVVGI